MTILTLCAPVESKTSLSICYSARILPFVNIIISFHVNIIFFMNRTCHTAQSERKKILFLFKSFHSSQMIAAANCFIEAKFLLKETEAKLT